MSENLGRINHKKRLEYLDIAKGLGIIMVVWAHAQAPLSTFVNHFHMPFFFLVSGFLFDTKSSIKDFIVKKFKTLYVCILVNDVIPHSQK